MEIILEHWELEELLREALTARGIVIPEKTRMLTRQNKKKNTVRVVFKSPDPKKLFKD